VEWFQKAAEHGIATAQWKLGLAYLNGLGTATDDRKAAQWITRAANQGKPRAQCALSQLYFAGRGVPKDLVRAYTWASIASQELAVDEAPDLDTIRSQLTKDQLAAANRRVASWAHRNPNRVEPTSKTETTILDMEQ
jgi:hypothetical protein